MFGKQVLLSILSLIVTVSVFAQRAVITGFVRDDQGKPIEQAVVADEVTGIGTYTNNKGFYMLEIEADKSIGIIFGFSGYKYQLKRLKLRAGETRTIDVTLQSNRVVIEEFIKTSDRKREAGIVPLDISKVDM